MRVKKSSIYVALEVFRNSCRMVSCSWRNLTKGSFLLHIVTMSAVEITSSYVALCEKMHEIVIFSTNGEAISLNPSCHCKRRGISFLVFMFVCFFLSFVCFFLWLGFN